MIRNTQDNEKKDYGENEGPGSATDDSAGINGTVNNPEAQGDVKESAPEADGSTREEDNKADERDVSVTELKKKLKEVNEETAKRSEEVEALKDILIRRQADFDNYKKRMVKSQEEYRRQAIKDMSLDIISINDDLLRAIAASESVAEEGSCNESHRSFVEGVTIISRSIEDVLKKYGVVEIESLNREFDPNHNEAVEIDESDGVKNDTITKVYQKGFVLDELVIRPSKVRVTRPARKSHNTGSDDKEESVEKRDDSPGMEGNSGDIGLN